MLLCQRRDDRLNSPTKAGNLSPIHYELTLTPKQQAA
jgi:hypothetical protein